MGSPKPESEACDILEIIDKYFPKVFGAKESINWLYRHTNKSRQSEWQAFFFEEYCRPLLTTFLGGWHGARIIKSSRIDYQRYYNWDLKVHSIKNKSGQVQSSIILNDKMAMDRIISSEYGLGFIIAYVQFSFDTNGTLQRWRDRFEGRTKEHASRHHMMKKTGHVVKLRALFLKDSKMVKDGEDKGWIKIFYQGKQPTGDSRKPKYMINLDKVPSEHFIEFE